MHDIPGFTRDSYGKVCSSATNANPGDLDGRMIYYKPRDAEISTFQFAFAMPFTNGISGAQFIMFNTFQPSLNPSDSENLVANWIQFRLK